jgi:sugar-phosphatase
MSTYCRWNPALASEIETTTYSVLTRDDAENRSALRSPAPSIGPFDAAIFDMDGLLIDSEPIWHRVEIDILGDLGVPLTVDMCRQTKGRFVLEAVDHWFAIYPWDGPSTLEVASAIVDAMARELLLGGELLPGAVQAVTFFRERGMRTAVASSASLRLNEAVIARHGLVEMFEVAHSAEGEPAGKPAPAVFLTTARLLDVDPGRCVVLEDSLAGVVAAAAAGMACIAVPQPDGISHEEATVPAGDITLSSLLELDANTWADLCELRAGRK